MRHILKRCHQHCEFIPAQTRNRVRFAHKIREDAPRITLEVHRQSYGRGFRSPD